MLLIGVALLLLFAGGSSRDSRNRSYIDGRLLANERLNGSRVP